MKNLYGIFVGSKWAMTTNKGKALQLAKAEKGIVTSMPDPKGTAAWDGPTFRACSDVIADFR
jgi:hypothetical protein